MAQIARGPNHYRGGAIPRSTLQPALPRALTLPHVARSFGLRHATPLPCGRRAGLLPPPRRITRDSRRCSRPAVG